MRKNNKWFTLIELIISMTIFFMLSLLTYVNYAFYQNIAKVRLSLKEVSQSINDVRNMAINWFDKNWVNQSVWIYFDKNDSNVLKYYTFNYNSWIILNENNLFKEKKLQENINISNISGKNNILIYFSSIYWKVQLFSFDESWNKTELSDEEIDFSVSYKNALNYPLKRDLKYLKNTNVVDY